MKSAVESIDEKNSAVFVIGAGLSGLACARRLQQDGVPFIVLEAGDKLGGRLKTDRGAGGT